MLTLPEFEAISERIASARGKANAELEDIRCAMNRLRSELNALLPDEGQELLSLPRQPAAREAWLRTELAWVVQARLAGAGGADDAGGSGQDAVSRGGD